MQQLTGIDNFFLKSEIGNTYNHVASLAIYDPSTAPGDKVRFKDILKHFEDRLHVSKVFRRRLVSAPYGLDRPYWIEDPNLDIEFHIRHIALPHPSDWRQLMIQVARLHSRPLDRSRPLWEIYVIEGLDAVEGMPPGAFALFSKFHHASVDGMAAAGLFKKMHATSPEPEVETRKNPPTIYADREPLALELYARALRHTVDRGLGVARFAVNSAKRFGGIAAKLARQQLGEAAELIDMAGLKAARGYGKAPQTRFNQKLSANRVVEGVGLPFSDIKTIRAALEGATMNDIFLAVAGGALHKYLQDKGELPSESLRALMPISLRAAGEAAAAKGGNEVGGVAVLIHSEIADPIARLKAIHRDTASAKAGSELVGADMVQSIYNEFPFFASNFLIKNLVLSQLNCTVSNVRGPDVPLYVAGARAVQFFPVSIPIDRVGLNLTGFSYNGVLWISAVACRNMVPDPAFLAQCLRDAFDELLQAANAVAQQAGAATAKVGGKSKRAKVSKSAATAH